MSRWRYRLTYVDITTGQVLLVRGDDHPDYRAKLHGIPVRVICEEIEEVAAAPIYAAAA